MKELLEDIARGLVDKPEAVSVKECVENRVENCVEARVEDRVDGASDGEILYVLTLAKEDRGRLIGRQGRTLRAMRTLVRAVAEKSGRPMALDMAR